MIYTHRYRIPKMEQYQAVRELFNSSIF